MARVDHGNDRLNVVTRVELGKDVARGTIEFSCDREGLGAFAGEGGDNLIIGNRDLGKIFGFLIDEFHGGSDGSAIAV